MQKSVIRISAILATTDVGGIAVPIIVYQLFLDGERFGNPIYSFKELVDIIIANIFLNDPCREYSIQLWTIPTIQTPITI